MTIRSVIEVENLVKRFPGVTAVDDVSFSVRQGEIFGLLGPNGAGKSTTLSLIEGLRQPDDGRITVLDHDVAVHTGHVKRRIGVQLQSTSLLPDLTALEQVRLFGRLYGRGLSRETALNLLAQVGLSEKSDALPKTMSGGQQQRLALALALVNDPEIIFLDEPTAGLDPQSRRALWDLIRLLRRQGRTVVLTTHYLEEAEALCHRVGIIDHGRLLALDAPGGLINRLDAISTITTGAPLPTAVLDRLPGVAEVAREGDLLRLTTRDVSATIAAMLDAAQAHQIHLRDLHVRQPSLEDVFLHLTGRTLRES